MLFCFLQRHSLAIYLPHPRWSRASYTITNEQHFLKESLFCRNGAGSTLYLHNLECAERCLPVPGANLLILSDHLGYCPNLPALLQLRKNPASTRKYFYKRNFRLLISVDINSNEVVFISFLNPMDVYPSSRGFFLLYEKEISNTCAPSKYEV